MPLLPEAARGMEGRTGEAEEEQAVFGGRWVHGRCMKICYERQDGAQCYWGLEMREVITAGNPSHAECLRITQA
jgi:hypothetical protein